MVGTEVVCPNCAHGFMVAPSNLRRGRMVWSEKRQHFIRAMMTDMEWGAYRRRGSVD